VFADQPSLVPTVERPRRRQRGLAAWGEGELARTLVVRVGVLLDVPAAAHVVDDLPGALLGDAESGGEGADRERAGGERAEHVPVGPAEVVVATVDMPGGQLADEPLVREPEQDSEIPVLR
jgi:hypothetical protein